MRRRGPRGQTVIVLCWLLSCAGGTAMASLALREVVINWRALVSTHTPYADILAEILKNSLYQQVGRLVMEGLCWTAGIVAYVEAAQTQPRTLAGVIIGWLLIGFRLMLVANSVLEYLANRSQRIAISRSLSKKGTA